MQIVIYGKPTDTCACPPAIQSPCAGAVEIDVPGVGPTWVVNLTSLEDLQRFIEEHGPCTIAASRIDDFELAISFS